MTSLRRIALVLLATLLVSLAPLSAPAHARSGAARPALVPTAALVPGAALVPAAELLPALVPGGERGAARAEAAEPPWSWPLGAWRLSRPFEAPAHRYGPGHRGIDLTPLGTPEVRAPAAGVVAFSGPVAGRGVLTIDHGGGVVSTLEPVTTDLVPGTRVERGEVVATVALGGHAAPGDLHLGARRDGEYVNPLLFLGGVPRAVLLPCCAPLP